jgi:hypothetical protein
VKLAWAMGLVALAFAACSGRRLPPGTPPPEYEPPIVSPWPAENTDAGAGAGAASDSGVLGSPPALDSDLSLDAGPS